MTGGNLFGAVLGSFFFPGLGQGLAFHRNRMLVLAIVSLATLLAIVWSVWFVPVTFAVRIGGAIDAYRLLKRHTTPAHRVFAAIAIVVGAVGVGYVKLALEGFRIPSSSMYPTLIIGDHIHVDKLTPHWKPIERGEVIVFTQPCAQVPYVKRVIAVGGDTVEVRCSVVYVNGTLIESQLVAEKATYADYDEVQNTWFQRETSRYRETHGTHTYEVFHYVERPANDKSGGRADRGDFPRLEIPIAPSCQQSDYYAPTPGVAQQPTGTLVVTKPDAAACEKQAHFVVPPNALFVMGDNRNNANDSRYWGAVSTDAVIGRVIGIWLSAEPGETSSWGRTFERFGAIE